MYGRCPHPAQGTFLKKSPFRIPKNLYKLFRKLGYTEINQKNKPLERTAGAGAPAEFLKSPIERKETGTTERVNRE